MGVTIRPSVNRLFREIERFPLLIPCLSVSAAALITWYLGYLFLLPIAILLFLYVCWSRSAIASRRAIAAIVLSGMTAFRIGMMKAEMTALAELWPDRIHTLEGILLRDPELTSSGRLGLRIRDDIANVLIWYDPADLPDDMDLRYGDLITVRVQMSLPPGPKNPGSFDYCNYLMTQKIPLTANPLPGQPLRVLARDQGNSLLSTAFKLRRYLSKALSEALADQAALPQAMLLGLKDAVPDTVNDSYAKLGLSHILVTSGAHVALLIGMLDILLHTLRIKIRKRRFMAVVFLGYYALMTAFAPAVIRAVITRSFSLIMNIQQKPTSAFQNLLAASFLIIFFQPQYILQLGFRLSLVMTLLIITCSPAPGEQSGITTMLKMQGTAMILALPINLRLNGGFHLFSIVLNLTVNPLLEAVSIISLPLLLVLKIPFLEGVGALLAMMIRGGLAATEFLTERALNLDFLYIRPNYRMAAVILPVSLFLILILGGRSERLANRRRAPVSRRRLQAALLGGFCFLSVLVSYEVFLYWRLGEFTLTALDIGQGDCVLLRERGRGVVMIDTGKPGELPMIWEGYRRVRRLPARVGLLLTHLDLDHQGEAVWFIEEGYANLLGLSGAERLYYETLPADDKSRLDYVSQVESYQALCSEYDIPFMWLNDGDQFALSDQATIRVLPSGKVSDANNASLVTMLTYRDTVVLLTGDAESEREAILMETPMMNHVDLLKVGHHGSKNGTSHRFLQHIRPGAALISAGVRNTYNHPSNEVLNRLEDAGVAIYRTDTMGAIEFSVHDGQITVRTYLNTDTAVLQSNAHSMNQGGRPVG